MFYYKFINYNAKNLVQYGRYKCYHQFCELLSIEQQDSVSSIYRGFDITVKNFLWSNFVLSLFISPSHGSEYLSSNFSVNSLRTSRAVEIFSSMAVGKTSLVRLRRL